MRDESQCEPVDLQTLLTESDMISLNAYLSEDSYHMLGAHEISQMKEDVIIINTARGELVDDKAILDGIKTGKIFAYGADVVEGEPIHHGHALLNHDRVLVTPHISAYTYECLEGMGDTCVTDCERVVNGMTPLNLINTELLSD